jgi:anti-sigma factor RsiW
MNRQEMNDLLADYLGHELSPSDRARFERSMAADAEFAEEVAEMQRALAAMRSLEAPAELVGTEPRTALRFRPSQAATLLRYAAIVLFAFVAGYAARWATAGGRSSPSIAAPAPEPARNGAPGDFEQRFAEAYGRSAGRSDLARSLIALSRATQ